jgi:4-amino-4-deoxy-L-arabinose transferase-like glycosyltransferase
MPLFPNSDAVEVPQVAGVQMHPPTYTWVVLWFTALMLMTVGLRVADPTGWLGSDDASYYNAAEHLIEGKTIHRVHHHFARMAVIVPVAASVWIFGSTPFAVAMPAMMASILCVALVAILGRIIWGWWEGLCAATIVSVLPYFRVLSTTGYPDVHACLWVTVGLLLAVVAVRVERAKLSYVIALACGMAIGLATSAKVFSLTAFAGVAALVYLSTKGTTRRRLLIMLSIVAGTTILFVVDGLFYLWAADDFLFKYHALVSAQSNFIPSSSSSGASAVDYAALAWDRLTMFRYTTTSGWGLFGLLCWPTACIVLLFNGQGRSIAFWGIATYLAIALTPVSFKNGPQPYPSFHGRHILIACAPFALCIAWTIRRTLAVVMTPAWVRRGWPALFLAIIAIGHANPHELNGFRNSYTSRVGRAIQQVIASNEWDDGREIFMPAPLYLRYRILFPETLRERLRVAVDSAAPSWWRDASVDIVSKSRALPQPSAAYLLATASQLRGEPEFWDYGVGLPRAELSAWKTTPALATIVQFKDKSVGTVPYPQDQVQPLLLLLGSDVAVSGPTGETSNDASVG